MNKAAIKAELRRSACEDESPIFGVGSTALHATFIFRGINEDCADDEQWRTFFLFVAEAL